MNKKRNIAMENKELHKKKWEKPEFKTFDINKTYGGIAEHSVVEDTSYRTPS